MKVVGKIGNKNQDEIFEVSGKVTIDTISIRPLTDINDNVTGMDLLLTINIHAVIDGVEISDYKINNTHYLNKADFEKLVEKFIVK